MATRGTPIPFHLRGVVRQLVKQGHLSLREIARRLGISHNTVAKYADEKSFGEFDQNEDNDVEV
jgi:transcriptional regulator with XRE-family HTH domain